MKEPQYDVLIVGAGFAGMYLLHRLRGLGLSAHVLEAGGGVGGTWYWNRYPGARCDVESMQYSYQFDPDLQQDWEWSERYSPQPEILRYAEHVADRFDLNRDISFNARVSSAEYDPNAVCWTLTTEAGASATARFCVMATGCLSKPNWPAIPGLDSFAGPVHHTALWPHEPVDFTGLRVAIIGTGSSAIQSLPLIAEQAKQVTVFQRTASYAIPAHNRPLDPAEVAALKARYPEMRAEAWANFSGIHGPVNPGSVFDVSPAEREAAFRARWDRGGLGFTGAFGDLLTSHEANQLAAEFVRERIRELVDDPETAEALCPTNVIGAKRICVDTDYFATYNRPNVSLIPLRGEPIEAITSTGLRVHGQDYAADMLVIATGFDAMTGALNAIDIRGRDGVALRELWAEGPSSYLGLAMSGFPNLFTVTGPGSPSVFTNMLPTIEQHVDWIADCIGHVTGSGCRTIEAEPEAERAWWAHVQEVGHAGLKASADSWYIGANVAGKPRVFMPYFGGFPAYCRKCDEVVAEGYAGFVMT